MLDLVVFTWEKRPPSPMENNSVLMSSDQGWLSFCDSCIVTVSGALASPFLIRVQFLIQFFWAKRINGISPVSRNTHVFVVFAFTPSNSFRNFVWNVPTRSFLRNPKALTCMSISV